MPRPKFIDKQPCVPLDQDPFNILIRACFNRSVGVIRLRLLVFADLRQDSFHYLVIAVLAVFGIDKIDYEIARRENVGITVFFPNHLKHEVCHVLLCRLFVYFSQASVCSQQFRANEPPQSFIFLRTKQDTEYPLGCHIILQFPR